MRNDDIPNLAQTYRIIGRNIRNIREGKGLKREDLEDISSIQTSYLGCIERGETNPEVKTLVKLSNALGVGLEKLFVEESLQLLKAAHLSEYAEEIMALPEGQRETVGQIIQLLFELLKNGGEKKSGCELSGGAGAAVQ